MSAEIINWIFQLWHFNATPVKCLLGVCTCSNASAVFVKANYSNYNKIKIQTQVGHLSQVDVRVAALGYASAVVQANADTPVQPRVVGAAADRVMDLDDKVRCAAVVALCSLGAHDLRMLPPEALQTVGGRSKTDYFFFPISNTIQHPALALQF